MGWQPSCRIYSQHLHTFIYNHLMHRIVLPVNLTANLLIIFILLEKRFIDFQVIHLIPALNQLVGFMMSMLLRLIGRLGICLIPLRKKAFLRTAM